MPVSRTRYKEGVSVRLEWDGKPTHVERLGLPFQTVETINESRATRERDEGSLLAGGGSAGDGGWRNQLIWGDNRLVMSSLLRDYAGKVDLVYIDPPFATGDDFSMQIQIGDASVEKQPSVIEEYAYRDTWGHGRASWFSMMYERLVLMRELLASSGSIYIHVDWYVGHHLRPVLDEIFGESNSLGEVIWAYGSPSGGRVAGKKLVKAHDFISSTPRKQAPINTRSHTCHIQRNTSGTGSNGKMRRGVGIASVSAEIKPDKHIGKYST